MSHTVQYVVCMCRPADSPALRFWIPAFASYSEEHAGMAAAPGIWPW